MHIASSFDLTNCNLSLTCFLLKACEVLKWTKYARCATRTTFAHHRGDQADVAEAVSYIEITQNHMVACSDFPMLRKEDLQGIIARGKLNFMLSALVVFEFLTCPSVRYKIQRYYGKTFAFFSDAMKRPIIAHLVLAQNP